MGREPPPTGRSQGSSWRYYRARRLLAQTSDVKDQRFLEAENLVDELRTRRPFWPPAYLLCGLVAKQHGATDQAIEAYKNAIRFGDQRIQVYEQLIESLYAERRFSEAAEYLGQLQEQVPLSEGLSTVEISLATQAGQLDRAVAAARRGAETPQGPDGANLVGSGPAGERPEQGRKASVPASRGAGAG